MCFKGIDFVAAVTIVGELGDLHRFEHPKQLMAYLGLVPSEYSSGTRAHPGQHHQDRQHPRAAHPGRVGLVLPLLGAHEPPGGRAHSQDQPKAVRDIAWRAQLRLCARYRRSRARGMHSNKICVAMARELAGFIWEAARHVQARCTERPEPFTLPPLHPGAAYRHPSS